MFFTFLKLYKWYQIVQRITGRYEIPKKSKLKGPLYLIMQVNKQIKKIGKGQKKVSIILMITESWNLIEPKAHLATLNKSVSLKCYVPLIIISMQEIKGINWFFPVLLLIKESFDERHTRTQLTKRR